MIIQVQLAVFFFSTCFVLLKNSTQPSLATTLASSSSATSKPTCLPINGMGAIHQISESSYLNFFSITSGDTTQCADVIQGMDSVIKQHEYSEAALLIKNRKIILSPTNDVGIGERFDAQYDPEARIYALGKSAMRNPAHLESKLREIFFYGACHAYQLTQDQNSYSCRPYLNNEQKDTLNEALETGYKNLNKYRKNLQKLFNKRDRNNANLKMKIKEIQGHYTYLQKTNFTGEEIYKDFDPLEAAIAEAQTMFIPKWLEGLQETYNSNNILKIRIGLLYGEIPKPIIDKFFPEIKAHVDEMVKTVRNNQKHDLFANQDNNIYNIDELIEKIDAREQKNKNNRLFTN